MKTTTLAEPLSLWWRTTL